MFRHSLAIFVVALATNIAALAQSPQPYAGLQTRPIKALSDQQISDLKFGRGMGLALAAELNGYPGPLHVVEFADQLDLSASQRKSVQQLFDSMKAETIPLGEHLIAREMDLDQMFLARTVTPASLKTAMSAIGEVQGQLREAHLRYHLATAVLLTPDQMKRYEELRGYSKGSGHSGQHRSN